MRSFIETTEEAGIEVARIVDGVQTGVYLPLVGVDLETSPLRFLVGYPNTQTDDEGEPVKPKKKDYLAYAQKKIRASFIPEFCESLGLPRKLTAGNESPGVSAKLAWESFSARFAALTNEEEAESARWNLQRLEKYGAVAAVNKAALTKEAAYLEAVIEAKEKGKVLAAKKRLKEVKALLDEVAFLEATLADVDLENPIPLTYLQHVTRIGVDDRLSVDPVRPGLKIRSRAEPMMRPTSAPPQ